MLDDKSNDSNKELSTFFPCQHRHLPDSTSGPTSGPLPTVLRVDALETTVMKLLSWPRNLLMYWFLWFPWPAKRMEFSFLFPDLENKQNFVKTVSSDCCLDSAQTKLNSIYMWFDALGHVFSIMSSWKPWHVIVRNMPKATFSRLISAFLYVSRWGRVVAWANCFLI